MNAINDAVNILHKSVELFIKNHPKSLYMDGVRYHASDALDGLEMEPTKCKFIDSMKTKSVIVNNSEAVAISESGISEACGALFLRGWGIKEVKGYLESLESSEFNERTIYCSVDGVSLDGVVEIDKYVSLRNGHFVENDLLKGVLFGISQGKFPEVDIYNVLEHRPLPSVCIQVNYEISTNAATRQLAMDEAYKKAMLKVEFALAALALAGDSTPVLVKSCEVPSHPLFPVLDITQSTYPLTHSTRSPLRETSAVDKDGVVKIYNLLEDFGDRKILNTSLNRLSHVLNPHDSISRAIDLGLIFELILMSGDSTKSEIGYKLKVRASRLLGNNIDERIEIGNLIKTIYNHRSKAAHDALSKANDEFYENSITLAKRLIIKMIENKTKLDWVTIENA